MSVVLDDLYDSTSKQIPESSIQSHYIEPSFCDMFQQNLRGAGVNPTVPSQSSSPESSRIGSDLLAKLRSLEKSDYSDPAAFENVVTFLQKLIGVSSRRGLLQGDVAVAEKVLAAGGTSQGTGTGTAVGKGGRQGKRGRAKDSAKNDLVFHNENVGAATEESGSTTTTLDVQLIVSAVTRILGGHTAASSESTKAATPLVGGDKKLVVALAADLSTAICEFIKSQPTPGTCTIAEYELIASSGKLILAGLAKTIRNLLSDIGHKDGTAVQAVSNHEECVHALVSCLRASASLVGLFGTTLSRSTPVLAALQEVGWDTLTVKDESVTYAAAMLLASLPFAGGADRSVPADLWNTSLADSFASMSTMLKAVAPINKKIAGESTWEVKESTRTVVEAWIGRIQSASSERDRVQIFLQSMSGLTRFAICLLDRNAVAAVNQTLLTVEVDISLALDLVEMMLSFPVVSESTYYGTKKRLRLEPVESGLLSPASIAGDAANHLKVLGHEILDALLSALGGPMLLPHARRITRVAYASLLTSCSAPLRKVLDPSSAVQLDGKKRRWLHTSIPVRMAAVKTLQETVVAFGVDSSGLSGRSGGLPSSKSSTDVSRSIALVGGCLIEQLSPATNSQLELGEWGSLLERTHLTVYALDCLSSYVVTGGEYLPIASRRLVESIASTCLSSVLSVTSSSMPSFGMVKAAVLSFGTSCVCTPWPDGTGCSIVGLLRAAAKICENDQETNASNAATVALMSCDTVAFPRVPALQVITRTAASNQPSSLKIVSADAIAVNLESARNEIIRAQTVDAKDEEKRQQNKAEADSLKKAKRAKTKQVSPTIASTDLPLPLPDVSGSPDKAPGNDLASTIAGTQVDDASKMIDSDNESAAKLSKSPKETIQLGGDDEAEAIASEPDDEGDNDDDDDFPMIVDCAPDDDDDN